MISTISYLQVENVTKRYGELTLFENISFGINKDQKIALIAKNGTGKTSLLDIIAGKEMPDDGEVTARNDISIGYLEQNPGVDDTKTVIEQVLHSSNEIIAAINQYRRAIEQDDKNEMQRALEQMDALEAWDYDVKIKQILSKLEINNFDQLVGELSGGQKKRISLAKVLINQPDLLILDEPTNHLDLTMIEWLEEYLKKTNSTLLMVTHDRYFLDRVCNEIIEMDDNMIYRYRGNYSYFLEKRDERLQNMRANVEKANVLMNRELDWLQRMPKARGTKAKSRVDNFKNIEAVAKKKIDEERLELNIKAKRLGKKIIELYNLQKSFGDNIILDDFSYRFKRFEKVGIVGKNGSGKTTLLELIAGTENLNKGKIEIGETVQIGYYKQSGMKIDPKKRVIDVVRDEAEVITLWNHRETGAGKKMTAARFLEYFLFPTEMHYQYVSKLSGGEKRRLYLLTILMKNPNFIILDEPTNDLDIMTLNVLEDYLANFNGCVLVVSHDRFFMDKIVDTLFVFQGNGKVKNFPGNYSQYREHIEAKQKQKKSAETSQKSKEKPKTRRTPKKFSYKEKREYEMVENDLQMLEKEKKQLETDINSGNLPSEKLIEKSNRLAKVIELIDQKEMRWLELEELMTDE